MTSSEGAILLWRRFRENPAWSQLEPSVAKIMLDCVLRAQLETSNLLHGGQRIPIVRGSLVTSLRGISESANVSVQQVRSGLRSLEDLGLISSQTAFGRTIIQIHDFDKWIPATIIHPTHVSTQHQHSPNDSKKYGYDPPVQPTQHKCQHSSNTDPGFSTENGDFSTRSRKEVYLLKPGEAAAAARTRETLPKTLSAIRHYFPLAAEITAERIAAAARAAVPDASDELIADALRATHRRKQESAGLWIFTVPEAIKRMAELDAETAARRSQMELAMRCECGESGRVDGRLCECPHGEDLRARLADEYFAQLPDVERERMIAEALTSIRAGHIAGVPVRIVEDMTPAQRKDLARVIASRKLREEVG